MTEFERVIQMVAEEYHSTPEQVLRNMQDAIDEGLVQFNPGIQEMIKLIPHKGERFTPEELVMGMAAQLRALELLS